MSTFNDWMFLQFIDTSLASNVQAASKMEDDLEIVVQPPDHEMEMGKVLSSLARLQTAFLGLDVVLQMLESPAANLQCRWSHDF